MAITPNEPHIRPLALHVQALRSVAAAAAATARVRWSRIARPPLTSVRLVDRDSMLMQI